MATQNAIADTGVNRGALAVDGESDSETRRIHTRTRGGVNAVCIEILDASGNQIVSFGTTEYTTGDTVASPVGPAVLGQDYDDKLYPLPVQTSETALDKAVPVFPGRYVTGGDIPTLTTGKLYIPRINTNAVTMVDGSGYTQPVASRPETTGGLTIFRSIDLDETEEDVKVTAGQLYGWYIFNGATATRYVKLYNATAANVTVGTTTPVITIPVPAGSAANVVNPMGIAFSTAICAAATTGVADNDTGAPGANEIIINLFYA
jgi:hypothetical protein